MRDAEVAPTGEAGVGAGVDHDRMRHRSLDLLDAAVLGVVVHDDELDLVTRPVDLVEVPQARDRVLGALVVDEDD